MAAVTRHHRRLLGGGAGTLWLQSRDGPSRLWLGSAEGGKTGDVKANQGSTS